MKILAITMETSRLSLAPPHTRSPSTSFPPTSESYQLRRFLCDQYTNSFETKNRKITGLGENGRPLAF